MCCLQYEHDNYKEMIKGLPKPGSQIQTPDGPGKILKNEILEQKVVILLEDGSLMTYHKDELTTKPTQTKSPTI